MFVMPMHDALVVGTLAALGGWIGSFVGSWWVEPEKRPTRWWAQVLSASLSLVGFYAAGRWHLSATGGNTTPGRMALAAVAGMAVALVLAKVLVWACLNLRVVRVQPAVEGAPRP
jgi:hypothetical protein